MPEIKRPITVVSGGDVMLNERLINSPAAATDGARPLLTILKQADILFVNLETALARNGYRSDKYINLRSDPSVATELVSLGVDLVALANNHVMDYGYGGLFETMEALRAVGLPFVGAGNTLEETFAPYYREVNGRRFAFLAVACTLPPGSAAATDRPGIAPIRVISSYEINPNLVAEQPGASPLVRTRAIEEDVARFVQVIAETKKQVDHVIVAVHWGVVSTRIAPYQGPIAEYQPLLGRALIDAGADLVLGNHSHNLHGIEVYKSKPIFYSFGNLIFQHLRGWHEPESVIMVAEFGDSGMSIRLMPVLLNAGGFPEMPSTSERDRIVKLLCEKSKSFGTAFDDTGEDLMLKLGIDG